MFIKATDLPHGVKHILERGYANTINVVSAKRATCDHSFSRASAYFCKKNARVLSESPLSAMPPRSAPVAYFYLALENIRAYI